MIKKKSTKFFNFFKECISFGTPRAIVFNISTILFILTIFPTKTFETGKSLCIYKNLSQMLLQTCPINGFFTGCNCPACGLTRGVSSILHGNFSQATNYNILSLPIVVMMITILIINLLKLNYKKPIQD